MARHRESGEIGERLSALRQTQAAAHYRGQSAVETARKLADGVGDLVSQLFVAQTPPDLPLALVALGSLGRRDLSPHSDLDLVVVSGDPVYGATGSKGTSAAQVVEGFFYPLWDAGLVVGHAVRTVEEFAQLARADDTVRTAALDWRALAGDASLCEKLERALAAALRGRRSGRYIADTLARRATLHSPATLYKLEPDIKDGPGGLRELQELWWLARLVWNIEQWPDLLTRDLIAAHDYEALVAGREVILGIRLAMHFCSGRRQDQLRFDLQPEVAAHLARRLTDDEAPAQRPEDRLLFTFYRHAKAVRAVTTRILERCADELAETSPDPEPLDGFVRLDDRLTMAHPEQPQKDPLALLRIFRVGQLHGLRLHGQTRTRIAELAKAGLTEELCAETQAVRLFLDILGDPRRGGQVLEQMHELGVLERLLPELRRVTGLVQRDAFHTYTVDAHLVFCASRAMALLAGNLRAVPQALVEAKKRIARPHLLVLAALLHDIGKGYGHGHVERGAKTVREIAERFRLSRDDTEDLVFLVAFHLEMFKISQRRDLEDLELIQRFAAEVETIERLNMLFVLSYVDALTTGPAVWSEWKEALLTELYTRARHALAHGAAVDNIAARAARRCQELFAELGSDGDTLRTYAARLPARHLVSFRNAVLHRQLETIAVADRGAGVAVSIAQDTWRGGWEVVVVGPDRPGLLADLTAVLAAFGVSIDAAHISAMEAKVQQPRMIVDTFVIRQGDCEWLGTLPRRRALEDELIQAVQGQADPKARLAERQRTAAILPSGVPPPEVRVLYDLGADSQTTVVDVYAPDRVGLLHDMAGAIFAAGASIVLARITTEGECAADAFYLVASASGQPLNATQRQQVEVAIRAAI